MVSVRLLVVDDDPVYRRGVRAAVELDPELVVVGERKASDRAMLAEPGLRRDVDVVLIGSPRPSSHVPEIRALSAPCRARGDGAVPVLVASSDVSVCAVVRTVQAGARGYLTKETPGVDIVRAVHLLSTGGSVFGSAVFDRLRHGLSVVPQLPARMAFPALSVRETEVLALLAEGWDNRRISRNLVVTEKTVRNHVTRIFRKLEVCDRFAAMARAREAGIACER